MTLITQFDIGQDAYLKMDSEQKKRMVTGITIRLGNIQYALACGAAETWHYEFEISPVKDEVTALTNNNKE